MAELICDGCLRPIADNEWRIYRGWRFTGTSSYPPHPGDTTHMIEKCQKAYLRRRRLIKKARSGEES